MEGWANDNTAESWKTVMNNDYIITLEDMPGWDKYEMQQTTVNAMLKRNTPTFHFDGKTLQLNLGQATAKVSVYDLQGNRILAKNLSGNKSLDLSQLAHGKYMVKVNGSGISAVQPILIK